MRVDLAAQVGSCVYTRFVAMVNKFFDTLNVHNYDHGCHSRKMFQQPYEKKIKKILD